MTIYTYTFLYHSNGDFEVQDVNDITFRTNERKWVRRRIYSMEVLNIYASPCCKPHCDSSRTHEQITAIFSIGLKFCKKRPFTVQAVWRLSIIFVSLFDSRSIGWFHVRPPSIKRFSIDSFCLPRLRVCINTIWRCTVMRRHPGQWISLVISYHLYIRSDGNVSRGLLGMCQVAGQGKTIISHLIICKFLVGINCIPRGFLSYLEWLCIVICRIDFTKYICIYIYIILYGFLKSM